MKKAPLKTFLDFKKWVKSIQTAGYNGARTVLAKINSFFSVWTIHFVLSVNKQTQQSFAIMANVSNFFISWEMDWSLRDWLFISTNNVWHSPLKYKVLDQLVGENIYFSFFFSKRHFYCDIRSDIHRKKTPLKSKNAIYELNLTYLKFVQCQG